MESKVASQRAGSPTMKAPHLLTEMNLTFSQYEFERAIYSTLSFGDETAIAELVGKSTSIIAQMYSPDCERESNLYKSARELAAFIQIDPDRGCQALQVFNEFVRRALP